MIRVAVVGSALLLLVSCAPAPSPAPVSVPIPIVCPPPPPPVICRYADKIAAWNAGWLASHLIPAHDRVVIADLVQAARDVCG